MRLTRRRRGSKSCHRIHSAAVRDLHLRVMATILEVMATFRDERARSRHVAPPIYFPCVDDGRRLSGPDVFGVIKSDHRLTKHTSTSPSSSSSQFIQTRTGVSQEYVFWQCKSKEQDLRTKNSNSESKMNAS